MRTLLLSLVAVLLVVDGTVHGLWTGRWQSSHALDEVAMRLPTVPMAFGEWQGQAAELGPRQVEVAGFSAYLLRRYERPKDGRMVDILVACGSPGRLSVHTPEACFGGAGFEVREDPTRELVEPKGPGSRAEFWKAKYVKPLPLAPLRLRVLWSWHAQGAWQAPDNPRWTFAGLPAIHKLYVTCPLTSSHEANDDAVCTEFVKAFLPELDKALFAASGSATKN